jgi:uncharacterized membrane protein YbhN (UPF0104 family)
MSGRSDRRYLVPVRALSLRVPRYAPLGTAALVLAALAAVLVPHSLAPKLQQALADLPSADPLPLWGGCGLFVVSLLCSAGAWRSTTSACGGRIGRSRAAASYGVGSLVNSLLPARLGDGVRVALFSRALPNDGRVWTAGGVFAAMGVARASVLLGLVVAAVAMGALPAWPIAALGGLLAVAAAMAIATRRTAARSRISHVLDAFRALARSPRTCAILAGWAAASLAARVGAAAAIAAAMDVRSPLVAALVIVPALELAGLIPLTPGNVGITSGTVAVALHEAGVGLTQALALGIALHAVELAAGLGFGAASALFLAGDRSPQARRVATALAAAGVVAVGAAFTGTVFVDLA